ncbi:hypothetical protein PS918_02950 [Pseudomonas fluorescens]|uniref:Lipoprotein n=1 Tax=Pseudomonas fluorescens TaxID=294 RepID=A0A5E7SNP8_PSEFL|nr:hypothetical protein [Pseudomonas fluorescens]VVP88086.1 hypothetical protein PS918_02950 [Pseudomonas fluorescens]
MASNLIKVALIAGAVLLSACSSVSTPNRYAEDNVVPAGFGPGPTGNSGKMNFHGSALGNSFGEYSSGLLHDD